MEALDDLEYLRDLIDRLTDAREPEAVSLLMGKIERSIKAIATVHFDYNREIFAEYDRHLAAHGMRATVDLCN